MPIHDWRRVIASTFHDFHHCWIAGLRRSLNRAILPPGYYAQAEQVATQVVPDVWTLQQPDPPRPPSAGQIGPPDRASGTGGLAVAVGPPKVSIHGTASEATIYAARRSQLVIRHATGHRIVAMLELVSPSAAGPPSPLVRQPSPLVGLADVQPSAVAAGDGVEPLELQLVRRRLGCRLESEPVAHLQRVLQQRLVLAGDEQAVRARHGYRRDAHRRGRGVPLHQRAGGRAPAQQQQGRGDES
jgi:hypothetical protein